MKKIFILFTLFLFTASVVSSMTFDEAFSQVNNKPMAVLVYADWADGYQNALQQFKAVQNNLAAQYNFVEMDIATINAKSFNKKYHIYPNLPYVTTFRESGKISRYIDAACVSDYDCLKTKLNAFIR